MAGRTATTGAVHVDEVLSKGQKTVRKMRYNLLPGALLMICTIGAAATDQDGPVVSAGRTELTLHEGLSSPLQMAWLPSGSFVMGSPEGEVGRRANEGPLTRVEITRGFWIGRYEVTHGQWRDIMGTSLEDQAEKALLDDTLFHLGAGEMTIRKYFGLTRDSGTDALLGATDPDVPMIWVSWEESVEFASRLTARMAAAGVIPEGYAFRLPTEAEWEYAARAGTTGATHAGEIMVGKDGRSPALEKIAWYAANAGDGYTGRMVDASTWITQKDAAAKGSPREVGTRQPNAWKLYDMLGNAAEWCMDWYAPLPGGSVKDPLVVEQNAKGRIRRGGGWSTFPANARSAYRNAHEENFRWINLGFRLVLTKQHE